MIDPTETRCIFPGCSTPQGISHGHNLKELVNHPPHYGGDSTYETIKVLKAWGMYDDALMFNAVKYLSRAGKKEGSSFREDVEKSIWYLQEKLKELEE